MLVSLTLLYRLTSKSPLFPGHQFLSKISTMAMAIVFLSLLGFAINTESIPNYLDHFCSNTTTFVPNSTYQSNLNLLLSSLSSNTTNGFHTNTSQGSDTVYGLFLCRGDVSAQICQDCVTFSTRDVIQRCPVEKVATIWYDECFLRYSNESFFNTMDDGDDISLPNTHNATNRTGFNELVGITMNEVAIKAASSVRRFSTGERNFSSVNTLYALVQCGLDQSEGNCLACLQMAKSYLPGCCDGKTGARVLMASCNIRYETYLFYNQYAVGASPLPPLFLVPPPNSGEGKVQFLLYLLSINHDSTTTTKY